jgi:hypothetical protein
MVPFVIESTGGIGAEGERLLHLLARCCQTLNPPLAFLRHAGHQRLHLHRAVLRDIRPYALFVVRPVRSADRRATAPVTIRAKVNGAGRRDKLTGHSIALWHTEEATRAAAAANIALFPSSPAAARPPIFVHDALAEADHAPPREGEAEARAGFIQALAALAEDAPSLPA